MKHFHGLFYNQFFLLYIAKTKLWLSSTRLSMWRPSVHYLSGLCELFPVAVSDGLVLQLSNGPQGGDHVLDGRVQAREAIPSPHLFIQHANVFDKCLTFCFHVLHIDVNPESGIRGLQWALNKMYHVPKNLEEFYFTATSLKLLELGNIDFKEPSCFSKWHHFTFQ